MTAVSEQSEHVEIRGFGMLEFQILDLGRNPFGLIVFRILEVFSFSAPSIRTPRPISGLENLQGLGFKGFRGLWAEGCRVGALYGAQA